MTNNNVTSWLYKVLDSCDLIADLRTLFCCESLRLLLSHIFQCSWSDVQRMRPTYHLHKSDFYLSVTLLTWNRKILSSHLPCCRLPLTEPSSMQVLLPLIFSRSFSFLLLLRLSDWLCLYYIVPPILKQCGGFWKKWSNFGTYPENMIFRQILLSYFRQFLWSDHRLVSDPLHLHYL